MTVTLIGWYVAASGTVTVRVVGVEEITFVLTDPKKTILSEGVELKFVPVMVTVVPMRPATGEKLWMVGTWPAAKFQTNKKIQTRVKFNLII